jgi:hypothetical protein
MMFPLLFAGARKSGNGIFSQSLSRFPFLFCAGIGSVHINAPLQPLEHICLFVVLTATVSAVVFAVVLVVVPMMVAVVLTRIRIFRQHICKPTITLYNIDKKFLQKFHGLSVHGGMTKIVVCIRLLPIRSS